MSRAIREPIYDSAIAAGIALFGFWRLRPTIRGAEHLPGVGGAVIAITHFGYLEFALVEWATWKHNRRRIRFMAKKSVFGKPVVGWLMRGMKHISVDMTSGGAAYADAVAALRMGELVGVFPEAGVSSSFTVRDLKSGAARLAAEAGVPIIPVAVWGGHRLMTKNQRVRWSERFGVPVSFEVGAPLSIGTADDSAAVTATLRERLQAMVDDLQTAYPVDGRGRWWQPRHLGGSAPTPEEATAADEERRRKREQAAATRRSAA